MIHLDTSFLVDLLRERGGGRPGPAARLLDDLADETLWVSVFVACELAAGIELSDRSGREREVVEDLLAGLQITYPDARFAPTYGRVFAELRRAGKTIAAMDLLIALSALLEGARLVTRNARHFTAVPGLEVLSY